MDIVKISAIGMIGAVLSIIIKSYKPEFSIHLVLSTVLIIFILLISKLEIVLGFFQSISNQININKIYFSVIVKILGVSYIADFTAQICKDADEEAIASKIEFAGKIIIMYLALPVFLSIIDLINKLLPE